MGSDLKKNVDAGMNTNTPDIVSCENSNTGTALVIGTSSEARYAIEVAHKRGYKVIAFDGDPNAASLPLADEAHVTDIRNADNITALLDNKPSFVLPVPIGRYLTSTGEVNDALGLKGISFAAAHLCTDKYEFHKTLSDNGLRHGFCKLIMAGSTANLEIGRDTEFPFILKPRFGSGSRSVYLVDSAALWNDLKADIFPADEDFIAESLYGGTEYGVDGCVFNGKLDIFLIRKKLLTPPPYRQCVGYLSVDRHIYSNFYNKATEYLSKVADTLHMNHCLFHCDFMCEADWDSGICGNPTDDEYDINLIEISARPSGHNLHNMFTPMVTGFSMIDRYIDYMEGKCDDNNSVIGTPADTGTASMLIGYFDLEACQVVSVPTADELYEFLGDSLLHYECNIAVGDILNTIENGHQLMSRGFFIIKGRDEADVLAKKHALLTHFGVLWIRD